MRKVAIAGVICLTLGCAIGYLIGRGADTQEHTPRAKWAPSTTAPRESPDAPREGMSRDPDLAHPPSVVSELRDQIEQLSAENRTLQEQMSEGQSLPETELDRYPIPRRLLPQLRIAGIAEDYTLGQDIVDVLQISDSEQEMLLDSLWTARTDLDALELKHAEILSETDTEVKYSVSPFEEEGTLVESSIRQEIESILGSDRSALFLQMSRGSMESKLSHFGKASQTITASIKDEAPGKFRIESTYKIESPGGSSSGRRSGTYDQIPDQFLHLFETE